jgi:hypothetical protein
VPIVSWYEYKKTKYEVNNNAISIQVILNVFEIKSNLKNKIFIIFITITEEYRAKVTLA